MEQTDLNNTILIVGAGMSINGPTSLPNGTDLTFFCLNEVLRHHARSIMKKWRRLNRVVEESIEGVSLGDMPRLESVIGAYKDVERYEEGFTFLQGFKTFLTRDFNEGHLLLAMLYELGASIITFNFDNCVIKAIKSIRPSCGFYEADFSVPLYKEHGRNNYILHLHGIANDISSLGFAVDKLLKGFKEDVSHFIKDKLHERKKFLVVGYSCSDTLDFNPLLKSLYQYNNSEVIYLDHIQEGYNILDIIEIEENRNIANFVKLFRKWQVIKTNSQDYLKKLIIDKDVGLYNRVSSSVINFWPTEQALSWENEFRSNYDLKSMKRIEMLLLIRIVDTLRIGFRLVKPKMIKQAGEKYGERLIFIQQNLVKFCAYKNLLKEISTKTSNEYQDKAGYNNIFGLKDSEAEFQTAMVKLNETSNFFWDTNNSITTIQNEVNAIIKKNILKNSDHLSEEDLYRLKEILKVTNRIGNLNLQNFSKPNLLGVARRVNLKIRALLFGERVIEKQKKILNENYIEISLLDGIPSIFRDMAITEYLCFKYHNPQDYQLIRNAKYYLRKSRKCSRIAGNKRDKKRAQQLLHLLHIRGVAKIILKFI